MTSEAMTRQSLTSLIASAITLSLGLALMAFAVSSQFDVERFITESLVIPSCASIAGGFFANRALYSKASSLYVDQRSARALIAGFLFYSLFWGTHNALTLSDFQLSTIVVTFMFVPFFALPSLVPTYLIFYFVMPKEGIEAS